MCKINKWKKKFSCSSQIETAKFVKKSVDEGKRDSFGTSRIQRTSIIPTDPLSREDGSENFAVSVFSMARTGAPRSRSSFFN